MMVGNYTPDCETTRLLNIMQAVQAPMHVIRYNPDAFKIDGKTAKISKKIRHATLRDKIQAALANPPDAALKITYLYYDGAEIRTETPDLPAGF